jgi:predicted alpha/beta-hydrolase family hydrolase
METNTRREAARFAVTSDDSTAGTLGVPEWWPSGSRVGVLLAHDASHNQDQPILMRLQDALVQQGYLALRFNFLYAEQGKKRPDSPALLERTMRAAVSFLVRDPQMAPAQLILAGVGLGARVAAQTIANGLKADALACLAFPLHPSGKPSQQQADFLFRLICPILFVQGTRDPYCRIDRLQLLLRRIGTPTQLEVVEDADHALSAIKRSARTADDVEGQVTRSVLSFVSRASSDH